MACTAKCWDGLKLFLTDSRIGIKNGSVERVVGPIAHNRKLTLFPGHHSEEENGAMIASPIETGKRNAVLPLGCLSRTLTKIVRELQA